MLSISLSMEKKISSSNTEIFQQIFDSKPSINSVRPPAPENGYEPIWDINTLVYRFLISRFQNYHLVFRDFLIFTRYHGLTFVSVIIITLLLKSMLQKGYPSPSVYQIKIMCFGSNWKETAW